MLGNEELLKELESVEKRLIVTEYNYDQTVEECKEYKNKYTQVLLERNTLEEANKMLESKVNELKRELNKLTEDRENTTKSLINEKDTLDKNYNSEMKMKYNIYVYKYKKNREEEINQLQETSTTYLKTIEQQSELYNTIDEYKRHESDYQTTIIQQKNKISDLETLLSNRVLYI